MVSDLPHQFLPLPWKTSKLPLRFSEGIRWEMGAEQERESGCLDQDANLGCCWFFFCKSGLFQRQTYVQPIRGSFERGWRRRDSIVSLRYIYNLLTPNRSFLARFGSMPGEFSGANRVLARHAYRETKRAWSAAKVYEKGAIRYLTYLNLAKLAWYLSHIRSGTLHSRTSGK